MKGEFGSNENTSFLLLKVKTSEIIFLKGKQFMSACFIRPASEIREDIQKNAEVRKLYQDQKDKADYWRTNFSESVEDISGWGHSYVCPKCSSALKYDLQNRDVHLCPECNVSHDNQAIREAWNSFRRHDIMDGVKSAAVICHVEGESAKEYKEFILKVLTWYADHYDQFDEHGVWVGRAKLMGHTLDEACWGIKLLDSLFIAGIDPDSAAAQHLKKKLLVPMMRLIMSQPTNLMNISLWHAAFATGVGVYYKDEFLLRPYARYERSGKRLILDNITEDGLWKENSISYHYYALSAALSFYSYAKQMDLADEELSAKLLKAYTAPLKLLYPNGEMPATSDGWKYSLETIIEIYKQVYFLFKDTPEADELAAVIHSKGDPKPTANSLYFGIPPKPDYDLLNQKSVHMSNNKQVMLRSEAAGVFMKYGNLCAGHSHPDALELSIFPFSMDPGSLSYGAAIHGEYFYVNASHSTFMLDGQNQIRTACGTGEMSADGLSFSATVDGTYPGVTASRAVKLKDLSAKTCEITDKTSIQCDAEHQIDWIFHGIGDFTANGTLTPDSIKENENGFKYFTNIQRWTGDSFSCTWNFEGDQLTLKLPSMSDTTIYIATTPDNPTKRERHAILIRKQGRVLDVNALFTVIKK